MKRLYLFMPVLLFCFGFMQTALTQGITTKSYEITMSSPNDVYFLPGDTLVWQYTSAFDSSAVLWDFSNPELPVKLKSFDLPTSVPGKFIEDYYVTVNSEGVVTLFNASSFDNISQLSSIQLDLSFSTIKTFDFEVLVKKYGDYLYISGANENPVLKGLHIIDMSDPANMTFVANINDKSHSSPGGYIEYVSDFVFKDSVLFVLEQNFLATYSVENPANFEHGVAWELEEDFESISHIAFNDSTLFLIAGDYSSTNSVPIPYLYSININNPLESLEQKHYFNFRDNVKLLAKELILRGEYLYFASEQRNAQISGITNIGTRYFDNNTGNVVTLQATGDSLAFDTFAINSDTTIAVGLVGRRMVTISQNISSFEIPVDPGLSAGASRASVGPYYKKFTHSLSDFIYNDGDKGAMISGYLVQLFDMSDISNPIPGAVIEAAPEPYTDYTERWYPTQLSFYSGLIQQNKLYLAGKYASDEDKNQPRYVTDTLLVYDISDINSPRLTETAKWVRDLELKDELIYKNRLFNPQQKAFYNIKTVTNPTLEWDNPDGLIFSNDKNIITSRGLMVTSGLKFYQLSINSAGSIEVDVLNDAFEIEDLPSYSTSINAIAYQQDRLYVTASNRRSNNHYMITVDISNIQQPKVLEFNNVSKKHSILTASGDRFLYSLSDYDSDKDYRQLTIFEATTDDSDQFTLQAVDSIMTAEFGSLKWLPEGNIYNIGRSHLYVYNNTNDTTKVYAGLKDDLRGNPIRFELNPAYPNPFNPSVTIPFTLEQHASVKLSVYNNLGQKVATLLNREYAPGSYSHKWNPGQLASGMYIIEMHILNESGSVLKSAHRKVTFIK